MSGTTSRLAAWWHAPTRPPIRDLRGIVVAVVLPVAAIRAGLGTVGRGGWGEVGGGVALSGGLLVLAAEARYLRKPVEDPSASTAAESKAHPATLHRLYAMHGRRDIEGALAMFTDDVEWPDVARGRVLNGKDEIRAYWTEQFAEIDPHVEPLVIEVERDRALVRVHQVVRALDGTLLHEGEVSHAYTFRGPLICRMELA